MMNGQWEQAHEALKQFQNQFVPIGDAHHILNLSAQYGRRMILDLGIEGFDYIYLDGRIYVVRDFLEKLRARREA